MVYQTILNYITLYLNNRIHLNIEYRNYQLAHMNLIKDGEGISQVP